MATTHVHTCTYFDDGDPELLLCVCGARGLYLLEDDGDALLVALLEDEAAASRTTGAREDLAISA